jgi:patatin-like phospholipase/acyl hydrolase
MFEPAGLLKRTFISRYEDKALAAILQDTFGATATLGDDSLKTLLLLVMRNVTTDSPWTLSNNPQAKYNDRKRPDCNLNLPLWKLIRASTAAPTFFPPEQVTVGTREFIFVDGGITPYNNPAFQLFLMATTQPYNLNWATGEEEMLLVSVGTGLTPKVQPDLKVGGMHLLYQAQSLPLALMFAAQNEQDLLCRSFGKCLAGDVIDREVGDLIGATGPANPKLFTYARYDAELSAEGLKKLGVEHLDAVKLQEMDSVKYMKELQEVGRAIAQKVQLSEPGFAAFL